MEIDDGISLDPFARHWTLDGPKGFPPLFKALNGWLPPGSILYFEAGSPDNEIESFMKAHAIPEPIRVCRGSIPPQPIFHVPATPAILNQLATMMQHHAGPELAIHFNVYKGRSILLEWHDAFTDPLWIKGEVAEEKVRVFAERIGTRYSKRTFHDE